LFFLLTGKSTYEGDTLMKKLLAHREQPIPALRTIRPEVSEQLDVVFRKLVAKKVEDRFQTMTEVIAELERCTAGLTASVTIQQPATTTFQDVTFDFLKKPLEEPTILAKAPAKAAPGKTGNGKKIALIGAAVLGVLILAGIIVSLKTKDGTLVVEIDQPDAMVQVLDAEGKVEISQKGGKGLVSISVDPGKHRLQIEKDGFTVFGQDFEMKSGGKTPIKAKLVPLEEKSAMVETKPAPRPAGTKPPVVAGPKMQLFFQTPGYEPWAKEVAALPAEQQVEAVSKKLVELNPGFDGKVTPKISDSVVTELKFLPDNVSDISPVRALAGLNLLDCDRVGGDLSETLTDLSPLTGMPLKRLAFNSTAVADLSPLKGMQLWFLNCAGTKVSDLSPLGGMPLAELYCNRTAVEDLSALRGMPLVILNCEGSKIADLTPLKALPLKSLHLTFTPERDTELIRSIKTLETINGRPVAEFWKDFEVQQKGKKLGFQMPGFDQWVKDVQALPAEKQVEAVSKKLVELNPGFDGMVTHTIGNGVVTELRFFTGNVTDISPVRALAGTMWSLACGGTARDRGALFDLSPLQGMLLAQLYCPHTQVSDLFPLKDMRLTGLNVAGTLVNDLTPLTGTPLAVLDVGETRVSDLSPLKGMPLNRLWLGMTLVTDLSPLKEMPLTYLQIDGTFVTELSPVRDLPLQHLFLRFRPDLDNGLLRSVKSLETINGKPAVDFCNAVEAYQTRLNKPPAFETPEFNQWVKDVASMPVEKQAEAVSKKLVELNPGFDGKVTPNTENGVVTGIQFMADNVTDISPVRAMVGLKSLNCSFSKFVVEGGLASLAPLKGMSLTKLVCDNTHVADLAPLQGMKLVTLQCYGTRVSDLSPLKEMPLASLNVIHTPIRDISVLKGMPLTVITMNMTLVTDLSPLRGMPLTWLDCRRMRVTDFTPLKDMPLQYLAFDFRAERDTELLRSIKTLETINEKPAAEFWKEVEGKK